MGLMDHGIHLIDVFKWLTKAEVVHVVGRGNLAGEAPRTEFLHMEYSNGAAGMLTYNDATFSTELPGEGMFAEGSGWDVLGYVPLGTWCAHPGSIEVFGTEGSLRIFHYTNALFLFDASGIRRVPLTGRPSPGHFGTQIEAFASSLRLGDPPPVPASDGIRALAVALSVYNSLSPRGAGDLSRIAWGGL
jgi:predicted dehydrogenase